MTQAAQSCPLCGGDVVRHVATGYDRFVPRPGDFEYVRCEQCSLVRQDPLPAPEALAGFYPDGCRFESCRRRQIRREL